MKCIYQILNKVNGKFYIGSAKNFNNRRLNHLSELRRNTHHSPYLQHSWNKYEEQSFEFIIIEELKEEDNLLVREQFYLDTLTPEYNVCKVAGSLEGQVKSPETILKMIASAALQKQPVTQYTLEGIFVKDWESIKDVLIRVRNFYLMHLELNTLL
jgi:group I intron endonuclease